MDVLSDSDGVNATVNGKKVLIGYIKTIEKTDYVYNLEKELVATVYNNDYKLAKVLSKLEKEIEKKG